MNTSFSKKRYIAEVNQRLEERYLSDKIKFVLNEQEDQNFQNLVNLIKNELKSFNTDEDKVLSYLPQITSRTQFNNLIKLYPEFINDAGSTFANNSEDFDKLKNWLNTLNTTIKFDRTKGRYSTVDNQTPSTANNWPEKYNCVLGFSKEYQRYNLEDGSTSYLIRGKFYYSNGRGYDIKNKQTFSYECSGTTISRTGNIVLKGEEAAAAENGPAGAGAAGAGAAGAGAAGAGAAGAAGAGAARYNSQNDPNFKLDGTTRTIQKDPYQYKLINCIWHFRRGPKRTKEWTSLANNQKSIDYLNSKFPDDIKNCPKPTSPEYQAQDNLDPDQMGTTNVQNPQVAREVIQTPQALQQRTNQQNIPKPQISLAAQQAAGKQIQDRFNKLKTENPNLTTDQINAILRQDIRR